jgi:hypothetical protein
MVDRDTLIRILTNPDMDETAEYRYCKGHTTIHIDRVVDHYNVIYRVRYFNHWQASNASDHIFFEDLSFEEMTPWNAVDKFEELYNKMILSESLFGWIGAE